MQGTEVSYGLRVKITQLGDTKGMNVDRLHTNVRKEGIEGIVDDYVPGHNRNLWFIKHEPSGEIGVYFSAEFEPA